MTPRAPTLALDVQSLVARAAMAALIEAPSLSLAEGDPTFPAELAKLAWRIADAMSAERRARQTGRRA
jgi:hypothetical protein